MPLVSSGLLASGIPVSGDLASYRYDWSTRSVAAGVGRRALQRWGVVDGAPPASSSYRGGIPYLPSSLELEVCGPRPRGCGGPRVGARVGPFPDGRGTRPVHVTDGRC